MEVVVILARYEGYAEWEDRSVPVRKRSHWKLRISRQSRNKLVHGKVHI